jgi:hypothetical protein
MSGKCVLLRFCKMWLLYIKKTQITIYTIKLNELGLYVTYYFFHVTKNNYISLDELKYEQYLVICKYLNANLH